ncbi:MAG TPA: DUF4011 domain-containing protein, partial [Tepidisphaeraceae bacterium]|nr:DUF4011 domain-containing protein [Tepidisphaeraceae bacterium]
MAEEINLQSKIDEWREQLLDLSKRNRLISCKVGKAGAIELEHPEFAQLWDHLAINPGTFTFPRKSDLLGLKRQEGAVSAKAAATAVYSSPPPCASAAPLPTFSAPVATCAALFPTAPALFPTSP